MAESKPDKRRDGGKPGKPRRRGRRSSERAESKTPGQADPKAAGAARRRAKARPRHMRTARSEAGIWLYGAHAVAAALANPARRLHRLLATPEAAPLLGPPAPGRPPRPSVQVVRREALARVLPEGAVHQGLALLAEPLPTWSLADFLARDVARPETGPEAPRRRVLLALDQVTDPQNCGAILRSAAAFGAAGVMAPARHSAPESGALAKAASGALELVPRVEVGNLAQGLQRLKSAGFWILGLGEEGLLPLGAEDPGGAVVLVLGAEGRGLRRLTREACDSLVRLPTRPALTSLNVSNAAAVALYALLAA